MSRWDGGGEEKVPDHTQESRLLYICHFWKAQVSMLVVCTYFKLASFFYTAAIRCFFYLNK